MNKPVSILIALLIITFLIPGGCTSIPLTTTISIAQTTTKTTPPTTPTATQTTPKATTTTPTVTQTTPKATTTTPTVTQTTPKTTTTTPTVTQTQTQTTAATITPTTQTTPADLKVTSLDVTPIVAEPGQAVTVKVQVKNAGGTAGSSRQALNINGVEIDAKEVTVEPSTTNNVTFTITENFSGLYQIEVGGLTATLRVKQMGAYPHIINNYIVWLGKPGTESASFLWQPKQEPDSKLKSLALYDMIAIPYTVAYYAPESIRQLRKLNPRIKILALFWVGESDVADIRAEQEIHEDWFLHYANTPGDFQTPEQRRIMMGFPLLLMNPASEWSTYAPNYIHEKIMSSGLFDGVFCDMVMEWGNVLTDTGYLDASRIDINNDGVADQPDVAGQQYTEGMTQLLKTLRELIGQEAIIMCGCGATWSEASPYWNYANGLFQENALGVSFWANRDFTAVWNAYQINMSKPAPPFRINWIGADTNSNRYDDFKPDLPASELQKMRYGLAITLLDDGYFHFDCSFPYHCQLWWFPEYDANLGLAKEEAQQRSDGTWTREFENGIVLVNPTNEDSSIEFEDIYQDVTTGEKGTSFTIQSCDGRIFIKIQ